MKCSNSRLNAPPAVWLSTGSLLAWSTRLSSQRYLSTWTGSSSSHKFILFASRATCRSLWSTCRCCWNAPPWSTDVLALLRCWCCRCSLSWSSSCPSSCRRCRFYCWSDSTSGIFLSRSHVFSLYSLLSSSSLIPVGIAKLCTDSWVFLPQRE